MKKEILKNPDLIIDWGLLVSGDIVMTKTIKSIISIERRCDAVMNDVRIKNINHRTSKKKKQILVNAMGFLDINKLINNIKHLDVRSAYQDVRFVVLKDVVEKDSEKYEYLDVNIKTLGIVIDKETLTATLNVIPTFKDMYKKTYVINDLTDIISVMNQCVDIIEELIVNIKNVSHSLDKDARDDYFYILNYVFTMMKGSSKIDLKEILKGVPYMMIIDNPAPQNASETVDILVKLNSLNFKIC